jgi:copper(I)-binding protein
MKRRKSVRALRLEVVAVAMVLATSASAGELLVTDAWMRVLPAGLPDAGYFKIRNTGHADAVLTGARSSACGMLMLHKSSETNGVSSMDEVDRILIKAGTSLTFAPGGYHLMCMDPVGPFKPGGTAAVTLDFADGTSLKASFVVKNARGK